jgi:PmbA protein
VKNSDPLDFLDALVKRSLQNGADEADAVLVNNHSRSIRTRFGDVEAIEERQSENVGLRLVSGKRQAVVSFAKTVNSSIDDFVTRASAMAQNVPFDQYCGLAERTQICDFDEDLETDEPGTPDIAVLKDRALTAETSALAVDGITNSEGAESSWGRDSFSIVGSNGLAKTRSRSWNTLFVSVLAGSASNMQRDYDHATSVFASQMTDPSTVGKTAATRAVNRLNPIKKHTQKVPVVFENRIARSLVGHFLTAINGSAVARGTSFLKDKINELTFSKLVSIIDDPLIKRGMGSRPFDAEGISSTRCSLVDNGVIKSWILDLRTARQLRMETTGHASRSVSAAPSPAASNVYLCPTETSVSKLIRDIKQGFFVTELIGFGVNNVTGDYSRGASGFWIENGELAYPVSEVTISGNLNDMFMNMFPASDLEFRSTINSPTIRIENMTVAGQ